MPPIWSHPPLTLFTQLLDRQSCIIPSQTQQRKYNSQPSLYLFNRRETGTLSRAEPHILLSDPFQRALTSYDGTTLIPYHDGASVDSIQVQSKE